MGGKKVWEMKLTRRDALRLFTAGSLLYLVSPLEKILSFADKQYQTTSNSHSTLNSENLYIVRPNIQTFSSIMENTTIRYSNLLFASSFYYNSNISSKIINSLSTILYIPFDEEEFRDNVLRTNRSNLPLDKIIFSVMQFELSKNLLYNESSIILSQDSLLSKLTKIRDKFVLSGTSIYSFDSYLELLQKISYFNIVLNHLLQDPKYLDAAYRLIKYPRTSKKLTNSLINLAILVPVSNLLVSPVSAHYFAKDNYKKGLLTHGLATIIPSSVWYLKNKREKEELEKELIDIVQDPIFDKYPYPDDIQDCFIGDFNSFINCSSALGMKYIKKLVSDPIDAVSREMLYKLKQYKILITRDLEIEDIFSIFLLKTFGSGKIIDIPYFSALEKLERSELRDLPRPTVGEAAGKHYLDIGSANIMIFTKENFYKFKEFIDILGSYGMAFDIEEYTY